MKRLQVMLAASVLLAACGRRGDYNDYEANAEAAAAAAEDARQATYEEYGADRDGAGADLSNVDPYAIEDSGNYTCTLDCSGHEAGFAWAQANDVSDALECGGTSQSFIEGCEAFVEDRQEYADLQVQEAASQAADATSNESQEYEIEGGRLLDGRY